MTVIIFIVIETGRRVRRVITLVLSVCYYPYINQKKKICSFTSKTVKLPEIVHLE